MSQLEDSSILSREDECFHVNWNENIWCLNKSYFEPTTSLLNFPNSIQSEGSSRWWQMMWGGREWAAAAAATNLIFLLPFSHCWVEYSQCSYSRREKLLLIIDNKKTFFSLPRSQSPFYFHLPLNPAHRADVLCIYPICHNVEWKFVGNFSAFFLSHYFMPFFRAARSSTQQPARWQNLRWMNSLIHEVAKVLCDMMEKKASSRARADERTVAKRRSEWEYYIYFEMGDNDDINYTVQVNKSGGQSSIILGELSWAVREGKSASNRREKRESGEGEQF